MCSPAEKRNSLSGWVDCWTCEDPVLSLAEPRTISVSLDALSPVTSEVRLFGDAVQSDADS